MAISSQKKTKDMKLLACLTRAHTLGSGSNKGEAVHPKALQCLLLIRQPRVKQTMKYSGMRVIFWLDSSFVLINDLGNLTIELLEPIFYL